MIIEWREDAAELFLTVPTSDLQTQGIARRSGLIGADGKIDFATLRQTPGHVADGILRFGALTSGPDPVDGMTMMVHDKREILPYADPFDALMASSVCGVPDSVERLSADGTRLYLSAYRGMVADPDGIDLDLSMFAGPVEVKVFDSDGLTTRFTADPSVQQIRVHREVVAAAAPSYLAAVIAALVAAFASVGLVRALKQR
ncbi:hypothetical protein [Phaeobacter sp.]|uniref:hypothetical protein n=1 Tax=Phaeobacter sp. TaxID=1902409 RepID=UPI0025D1C44A|nr:hypothetical protein [Phaeobacter sp.]